MIGVDIINVKRVADLASKDKNNKVFTSQEINYANTKSKIITSEESCSQRDNTLAGMFNAKEAFLKALGFGLGDKFALNEIEVSHKESGEPFIVITEKIENHLRDIGKKEVNLSISHDAGMSIAVVEIL